MVVLTQTCAFCSATFEQADDKAVLCTSCHCVWYCSEAHQLAHWRAHKAQCKRALTRVRTQQQSSASEGVESVLTATITANEVAGAPTSHQQQLTKPMPEAPHVARKHASSAHSPAGGISLDCLAESTAEGKIEKLQEESLAANIKQAADAYGSLPLAQTALSGAMPNQSPADFGLIVEKLTKRLVEPMLGVERFDHSGNMPLDLQKQERFVEIYNALPQQAAFELHVTRLAEHVGSSLQRYGWAVVDKVMGAEIANQVSAEAETLYATTDFEAGRLVRNTNSAVPTDAVRGDKVMWLEGKEDSATPNINHLVTVLDSVVFRCGGTLKKECRIAGKSKAMISCFPSGGAKYILHVDNPSRDGRSITVIYNMNASWKAEFGGILKLYPVSAKEPVALEPIQDRAIFLWADRRCPYEIQPSYFNRFSLTIWYYDGDEKNQATQRSQEVAAARQRAAVLALINARKQHGVTTAGAGASAPQGSMTMDQSPAGGGSVDSASHKRRRSESPASCCGGSDDEDEDAELDELELEMPNRVCKKCKDRACRATIRWNRRYQNAKKKAAKQREAAKAAARGGAGSSVAGPQAAKKPRVAKLKLDDVTTSANKEALMSEQTHHGQRSDHGALAGPSAATLRLPQFASTPAEQQKPQQVEQAKQQHAQMDMTTTPTRSIRPEAESSVRQSLLNVQSFVESMHRNDSPDSRPFSSRSGSLSERRPPEPMLRRASANSDQQQALLAAAAIATQNKAAAPSNNGLALFVAGNDQAALQQAIQQQLALDRVRMLKNQALMQQQQLNQANAAGNSIPVATPATTAISLLRDQERISTLLAAQRYQQQQQQAGFASPEPQQQHLPSAYARTPPARSATQETVAAMRQRIEQQQQQQQGLLSSLLPQLGPQLQLSPLELMYLRGVNDALNGGAQQSTMVAPSQQSLLERIAAIQQASQLQQQQQRSVELLLNLERGGGLANLGGGGQFRSALELSPPAHQMASPTSRDISPTQQHQMQLLLERAAYSSALSNASDRSEADRVSVIRGSVGNSLPSMEQVMSGSRDRSMLSSTTLPSQLSVERVMPQGTMELMPEEGAPLPQALFTLSPSDLRAYHTALMHQRKMEAAIAVGHVSSGGMTLPTISYNNQ